MRKHRKRGRKRGGSLLNKEAWRLAQEIRRTRPSGDPDDAAMVAALARANDDFRFSIPPFPWPQFEEFGEG